MKKNILAMLLILLVTPCAFGQIYSHVGTDSCSALTTDILPALLFNSYTESQYVLTATELESIFPGTGSTDILEIGWYQCSGTIGSNQQLNVYFYETASPCDTNVCNTAGYPNGVQVVSGQQLPMESTQGWRMLPLDSPYTYTHGNCLVVSVCETLIGSNGPVEWAANFQAGNGYSRFKDHATPFDCNLETLDGSVGYIGCAEAWPSTRFLIDAPETRNLTMSNSSGTGFGTVSPLPGVHAYPLNATATIMADPQFGSDFIHWLVDSTVYSSNSQETLLMDSNHTVEAVFNTAEARVLPVCENFDSPWTGSPPAPTGWMVVNSDADDYTFSRGNSYIEPTVSEPYACIGMGCNDDWLISPLIDIPAGIDPEVVWWDKVESATRPNSYQVLISTTGNNISDFSVLATFNCTNESWVQHSVPLDSYVGETIYIAFHQTFSSSMVYGFGIDDLCIREVPVYVNLTMDPVEGSGRVYPPEGVHAFVQDTVIPISAEPDCGFLFDRWIGDVSDPFSATTTITMDSDHVIHAVFVPGITVLSEGFESTGPTDWSTNDADGDSRTWSIICSNTWPHSGLCNVTSASWESGPLTPDNWLISPQIDLTEASAGLLSWYVSVQDQLFPNEYYDVLVSITGDNIADFVYLVHSESVQADGPHNNDYWYRSISLESFSGEQIYFAFRHHNCSDLFRINLDDVCVTIPDPTVPTTTPIPPTATPIDPTVTPTPSELPPVPTMNSISMGILLLIIGILTSISTVRRR